MFEKLMFIIAFLLFFSAFLTGVGLFCSAFIEKALLTRGQMVGIMMFAGSCFGWYTMLAGKIVSGNTEE